MRESDERFEEARKLMESAESLLRSESLLLAKILNQAHYNIVEIRDVQKQQVR